MTVKFFLIFGKLFKIFKTVNHFSKLNSWSLHACLISDCWNPVMVGRRNSDGTEIRQHPPTRILMAPESSDIRPLSPNADEPDSGHGQKPDLAKMSGIRPDLAKSRLIRPKWPGSDRIWPKWPGFDRIWPDPEESRLNPATATRHCRIPAAVAFTHFVIFSLVPNAGKYFRENYFLKMISSKIFYDKNHFTSKQTEHYIHRKYYYKLNVCSKINDENYKIAGEF